MGSHGPKVRGWGRMHNIPRRDARAWTEVVFVIGLRRRIDARFFTAYVGPATDRSNPSIQPTDPNGASGAARVQSLLTFTDFQSSLNS